MKLNKYLYKKFTQEHEEFVIPSKNWPFTEEDVEARGGYPFPRQDLAEIHRQLLNEGALGVGWVILFPQPDRFGGDEVFKETWTPIEIENLMKLSEIKNFDQLDLYNY